MPTFSSTALSLRGLKSRRREVPRADRQQPAKEPLLLSTWAKEPPFHALQLWLCRAPNAPEERSFQGSMVQVKVRW